MRHAGLQHLCGHLFAGFALAGLFLMMSACFDQAACTADSDCPGQKCNLKAHRCEDSDTTTTTSTTTSVAPRCAADRPISCGPNLDDGCCPTSAPYCCEGGCEATPEACGAKLGLVCAEDKPGCTFCWHSQMQPGFGSNCKQETPYCCGGGIDEIGVCNADPGNCPGRASNGCDANKPIACGNGTCCDEDHPYCCSNGQCYAKAGECGVATSTTCSQGDDFSCGSVGCCPNVERMTCCLDGAGLCTQEPSLCGLR